jgi:hypothetical protein
LWKDWGVLADTETRESRLISWKKRLAQVLQQVKKITTWWDQMVLD